MTTAAKITFGNKIFIAAAPTAPTTIVAEVLSITPPKQTREMQDATTHDSVAGAEEVIPEGTYNPGEIEVQMHYIAGSTADTAFIAALTSGALQNLKIHAKSAAGFEAMTCSGYVTSYGPDEFPVKGKQAATAMIKISGAQTRAAV